jgi:hypothetical protein
MSGPEVWRLGAERPVDFHPGRCVALPAELRAQISADLAPLSALAPELPAQLLAFVESGSEQKECLQQLSSSGEAFKLWGLNHVHTGAALEPRYRRAGWLGRCAALDPVLLVRLGAMFAAARYCTMPSYEYDPFKAQWPYALLEEASPGWYVDVPTREGLMDILQLEAALVLAGDRSDRLVQRYAEGRFQSDQVVDTPGFVESVARHPRHVATMLMAKREALERALKDFGKLGPPPSPWLGRLVELATGGAKIARDLARQWLLQAKDQELDAVVEAAGGVLTSGDAESRAQAAELLGLLATERGTDALRAALAQERSTKVRSIIAATIAATHSRGTDASGELGVPPVPHPTFDPIPKGPLSDDVRALLDQVFDEWYALALACPHPTDRPPREVLPFSAEARTEFWRLLSDPAPWSAPPENRFWAAQKAAQYRLDFSKATRPRQLFDHEGLTPLHLVRLHHLLYEAFYAARLDAALRRHRTRIGQPYDLRTVARALEHCALNPGMLADQHAGAYFRATFRWEREAVWPYFAERLGPIDAALGLARRTDETGSESWAMQVLAWFPSLPTRYRGVLWAHAIGADDKLRPLAQKCLSKVPGIFESVVDALSDTAQGVRAAAASWLGTLGERRAIEVLKTALAKEKGDHARACCMEALEQLGVPPGELLDCEELCADAKRGMAKGMPAELALLDLDTLPSLLWLDGTAVPPQVVQWWILLAFRSWDPSGNGTLDAYSQSVQAEGRMALAQWLLDEWLREEQTLEERGLLALVSSFGGPSIARPASDYIHRWYGNRPAQCNQLLEMLAWNQSPAAIQCLSAIARRFRTASIKRKAGQLVAAIAKQNGWTTVQLADRSIPDAGLDARGQLELRYLARGSEQVTRRFSATLLPDCSLQLTDADGQPLKTLPKPRKDEDAAAAKRASEQLNLAKKEIKPTLAQQTARLFDAMCAQRAWSFAEWDQCFHRHPIASRLASGLVWRAEQPDHQPLWFRPLGDGALTSAAGDPVLLPADSAVRLAHASQLPAEQLAAWREHLHEFELAPSFPQLERAPYAPTEQQLDDTCIEQFQGYAIESFTLRRVAEKRGFDRGSPEDGGWFYSYRRAFAELGLVAVLEFSGSRLLDDNERVALKSLSFATGGGRIVLRDVAPVLLSECYNDLAEIAAAGSGFDPKWRKLSA